MTRSSPQGSVLPLRTETGKSPSAPVGAGLGLLGDSEAIRAVRTVVRRAAGVPASVLITGESGTGKDVVARALHRLGPRSSRSFVAVNCSAIPEGLLESELFGHVKGAFTGAVASKPGLFERAHGGTLFLDEIGDMGSDLQAKLLRVLQDQEVQPVGGARSIQVDVRIIAATHRDLDVEMTHGGFREDLYYRLAVIPIHLPPLRERPEDVPHLVEAFARRHGRGRHFSREAIHRLQNEEWRGNARELENFVERTLALCDARPIQASDLHLEATEDRTDEAELNQGLAAAARRGLRLRDLEDRYIEYMLRLGGGRVRDAARRLGVDRKTLYRRGWRSPRFAEKPRAET